MRLLPPAALAAAMLLAGAGAAPVAGHAGRDGATVFRQHCAQCHGDKGEGDGILANRYTPRPSNLAASTRGDEYRLQIITLGGAALGRSEVMPEWGLELSGQDILAVVEYLRVISNQYAAQGRTTAPKGGSSRVEVAQPHG